MPLLKDIAVIADRPLHPEEAKVENMSRVVCALLVRGLKRSIRLPDAWKITIHINPRDQRNDGRVVGGVHVLTTTFPVTEFLAWPVADRQDFMLQFVSSAVKSALARYGVSAEPLRAAQDFVQQSGFTNLFKGRSRFVNPVSGQVVRIECEQHMDEARLYVVLSDGRKNHRRVQVATTVPNEFVFQVYFGTVEWDSRGAIGLRRLDGARVPVDAKQLRCSSASG